MQYEPALICYPVFIHLLRFQSFGAFRFFCYKHFLNIWIRLQSSLLLFTSLGLHFPACKIVSFSCILKYNYQFNLLLTSKRYHVPLVKTWYCPYLWYCHGIFPKRYMSFVQNVIFAIFYISLAKLSFCLFALQFAY